MTNRRGAPASASLCGISVVALAMAVACGSNGNGPASPDGGGGQSDGGEDGSVATNDGSVADSSVSADSGADSGMATDSGAGGDTGILGANCPPFDAGSGAFVEAPHGPLPTMVYLGGGVLQAPQVVTFTFSTTPGVATLEAFGRTITQTPWFTDVSKDYCIQDGGLCIGPGPSGLAVEMSVAAQANYIDTFGQGMATGGVDLDTFINQQIAAAVTANTIPAPGPNSLYIFYFPPTSNIWFGAINQGGESCSSFQGYHSSLTYSDGVTPIAYAIVPDCPYPGSTPADDLQQVTIGASHEIIEAATDPATGNNASWVTDQWGYASAPDGGPLPPTIPEIRNDPWITSWQFAEVGDNCESIPVDTWSLDSGVLVQRSWSRSAAALGHNPCVPVPTGEAYYNASTDKVLYVAQVGVPFTIDVSAFTDMPRSSWRLDAVDVTPTQMMQGNNPMPYLQLEFVGGVTGPDGVSSLLCVNNGTTGQLKVTLLADPNNDTSLQQGEEWPEAVGTIYSADVAATQNIPLPDGGTYQAFPYQFWPFSVVTSAVAASIGVTGTGVMDAKRLGALRAAHHAHRPRGVVPPRLHR